MYIRLASLEEEIKEAVLRHGLGHLLGIEIPVSSTAQTFHHLKSWSLAKTAHRLVFCTYKPG